MDNVPATLECLLTPYANQLPVKVQTVYVQNIIKVYAYWVTELLPQWNFELQGEFIKVTRVMSDKMDMFIQSTDLEVQERVNNNSNDNEKKIYFVKLILIMFKNLI